MLEPLSPFITRVKREKSPAGDAVDASLGDFLQDLDGWKQAAPAAAQRFDTERQGATEALRPSFMRVREEMNVEAAWLAKEKGILDEELAALTRIQAERADLQNEVTRHNQQIAAAETTVRQRERDIPVLEQQLESLRQAEARAAQKRPTCCVRSSASGSNAVPVVDYNACPDAAAKLKYDRQRYEAAEKLGQAREALFAAQEARAAAGERALQAKDERLEAALEVAHAKGLVFDATVKLTDLTEEYDRRKPVYDQRLAHYRELEGGHARDAETLRQAAADLGYE